ncbi:MAG TPA: hypothetical protein ENG87_05590 [Candidatus Pacearchaeota archaeon]|nr:hypothetical protein [Candidatus Pacearchaeota archaeon]HDZ60195.1 hypothetical protein [Candidatus Pacearchaeota archaeon]
MVKILNNAYKEWEERCGNEMRFLFSPRGIELQLCLVSQGYANILCGRLMVLFGSGFTALKCIRKLQEDYLLIRRKWIL